MRTSPLTGRAGTRAPLALLFLLFILLLSPALASAQAVARQPTLSDKVVRVALLDHSRLRREFGAMTAARAEAQKAWQASERTHREALGKATEAERPALEAAQAKRRRQLHGQRAERMRGLEARITEALREAASEGGFTDVRPLGKGEAPEQGTDITELVLRKLN